MDKYLYKISNALLLRLEIACARNSVSLDEWETTDAGKIEGFSLTFDGGESILSYTPYTTESVKEALHDVREYEKGCKKYAVSDVNGDKWKPERGNK